MCVCVFVCVRARARVCCVCASMSVRRRGGGRGSYLCLYVCMSKPIFMQHVMQEPAVHAHVCLCVCVSYPRKSCSALVMHHWRYSHRTYVYVYVYVCLLTWEIELCNGDASPGCTNKSIGMPKGMPASINGTDNLYRPLTVSVYEAMKDSSLTNPGASGVSTMRPEVLLRRRVMLGDGVYMLGDTELPKMSLA